MVLTGPRWVSERECNYRHQERKISPGVPFLRPSQLLEIYPMQRVKLRMGNGRGSDKIQDEDCPSPSIPSQQGLTCVTPVYCLIPRQTILRCTGHLTAEIGDVTAFTGGAFRWNLNGNRRQGGVIGITPGLNCDVD